MFLSNSNDLLTSICFHVLQTIICFQVTTTTTTTTAAAAAPNNNNDDNYYNYNCL